MNANQYINGIVRKIKCGGAKKKEIKKQLLTDINFRLEQGESLTDIMSQMGTIKEISDEFNESLPESEKKKYAKTKVIKTIAMVFAILAVILIAVLIFVRLFFPTGVDIEESEYFDRTQVEQAMKDTIELLDNGDYAALQANAIGEMIPYLTKDAMEKAKEQVSTDWGKQLSIGTIYAAELVQGKRHYAVGEVTVSYENISVIYRLTYDTDMKLAGLYMR